MGLLAETPMTTQFLVILLWIRVCNPLTSVVAGGIVLIASVLLLAEGNIAPAVTQG